MSRSLNRVELLGHLGQDADIRYTQSGAPVATFSIATSERWKDKQSGEWKEETDWHRCILWNCEAVGNYLKKGKQLFLTGRMRTRKWEDGQGITRYITEVICRDVILLGGGDRAPHPASEDARPAGEAAPAGDLGITDDDVPF